MGELPVTDEPVDVPRGDVEDHGRFLRAESGDGLRGHVRSVGRCERRREDLIVRLWTGRDP